MRSTDDQSTIRGLLVVGLYCFRGLKIDFNQNLSLCDRCTKSVRLYPSGKIFQLYQGIIGTFLASPWAPRIILSEQCRSRDTNGISRHGSSSRWLLSVMNSLHHTALPSYLYYAYWLKMWFPQLSPFSKAVLYLSVTKTLQAAGWRGMWEVELWLCW